MREGLQDVLWRQLNIDVAQSEGGRRLPSDLAPPWSVRGVATTQGPHYGPHYIALYHGPRVGRKGSSLASVDIQSHAPGLATPKHQVLSIGRWPNAAARWRKKCAVTTHYGASSDDLGY